MVYVGKALTVVFPEPIRVHRRYLVIPPDCKKESVSPVLGDVWTNSHQLRDKIGRRDLELGNTHPIASSCRNATPPPTNPTAQVPKA